MANKMIKSKISQNSDKTKQKSILDYFGRKGVQLKRTSDQIEVIDLCDNKCHRSEDRQPIGDHKSSPLCQQNGSEKTHHFNDDITNQEFIDLSRFLEIDFAIEDKQIDVTEDQSLATDGHQTNESYVYTTFRQMIDSVLEDNHFCQLFDDEDMNVIQAFTCLSGMSQMLFVRLFLRKRNWIRKKTIKYPDICENLDPILKELLTNDFIFNASKLTDLDESLDVLDAIEIKRVGKSLKGLNMSGLNTKKNIINGIIEYLKTSQSVVNGLNRSSESLKDVLLKSIRSILIDKCFKINEHFCQVFERMFLLFCGPDLTDEDLNSQMSYEFFKILKVMTGKEIYPKYNISRKTVIHKTRKDLIQYCEAFKLEVEILSAIERKDFDDIVNRLMPTASELYSNLVKDREENSDSLLPVFLRRFTCGHTLIRCLSHCVTVLEQRRDYSLAVALLRHTLLNQDVYCQDARGRWFERLALNLDKHLKDTESALKVTEEALNDPNVRIGHRLALYNRQKNVQKKMKIKISAISEFESIRYSETTIFAETVKYAINDRKNIFKVTDSNGDVTVMPVEDIVIKHYKDNNFSNGIHTESQVYHTIFGLLFWDIIYMDEVCDVFRFRYQRLPLDFNCELFFAQRKTQIISLLNTLKGLSQTEISNVLENCWNNNYGTVSLVNWEAVDIKDIKEIVECFGTSIVIDICERLIQDFRHTRSGFPDLLVWDFATKKIKVVEVKGPNDRPSTKQKLWLTFLQSIGCDVEICHVKVKKSVSITQSDD